MQHRPCGPCRVVARLIPILATAWIGALATAPAAIAGGIDPDEAHRPEVGLRWSADTARTGHGSLILEWAHVEDPMLLVVGLRADPRIVEASPSLGARGAVVPPPVVVRAVDAGAGTDTLRIGLEALDRQYLGSPVRATACLLDSVPLIRMSGSVFVQGNLRRSGRVTLGPADVPRGFVFLRETDKTPAFVELESSNDPAMPGDPETVSYELEIPDSLNAACSTVLVRVTESGSRGDQDER